MRIRSFVSSAAVMSVLLTGTALVSYAVNAAAVSPDDQRVAQEGAEEAQSIEQLRQQVEQLKGSLSEVIKLAETLKTDNEKKAGFITELQNENDALAAQNAELRQKLDAQAEKASDTSQNSQPETEEKKAARSEPVRSVVLGDVAATTAREPEEVLQKMRPAEPAPEPQTEKAAQSATESKNAKVAPVPSTKPAVPAATMTAKADMQPAVEQAGAAPVDATAPHDENIRKIDAAMAVIEEEMRALDASETEQMQRLGRQYAYLKAQRSYLTQGEDDAAQDEAIETEQSADTGELNDEPSVEPQMEETPESYAVNEAQAYEASLKARKDEVAVVEQPEAQPEPEPISVSQSADPFAEMNVENEEGEVLAEAPPQEPVTEIELETAAPEAQAEPLQEAAQAEGTPPIAEMSSIEALITAAQVTSADRIKRVEKASDTYDVAYQWSGNSIYGSAEQKTLSSPAEFDELVRDYLERTQSRCPGEFAVVPDGSVGGGNLRADSYDVACVGQNVSSGASLLFFNSGGTFTVVAHEAPAEALDSAISMRNRVRSVVLGG